MLKILQPKCSQHPRGKCESGRSKGAMKLPLPSHYLHLLHPRVYTSYLLYTYTGYCVHIVKDIVYICTVYCVHMYRLLCTKHCVCLSFHFQGITAHYGVHQICSVQMGRSLCILVKLIAYTCTVYGASYLLLLSLATSHQVYSYCHTVQVVVSA